MPNFCEHNQGTKQGLGVQSIETGTGIKTVGESTAANINSYRVKVLSHDLSEEVEETMQHLTLDSQAL